MADPKTVKVGWPLYWRLQWKLYHYATHINTQKEKMHQIKGILLILNNTFKLSTQVNNKNYSIKFETMTIEGYSGNKEHEGWKKIK